MSATDTDLHTRRRARAMADMGDDAVMILPASPEVRAGRDLDFRYRPDADLYYLTGCREPEAVAVLTPGGDAARFSLFVRPRDPALELWTGTRGGPEAAAALTGADAAHPICELDERLPALIREATTIYYALGSGRPDVESIVLRTLAAARRSRQRTGRGPRRLADPGVILDEMRLVKDAAELERLREAARVTVEAFRDAFRTIRPDAGEWQVEAALEAGFRRRGADTPSFATIVASGANATTLHYIDNDRVMRAGELILLDAGARVRQYCADITRTVPVAGRFSTAHRDLYEIVRAAHDRAIAAVRPGATLAALHEVALHTLVEGLVGLGLLDGEPATLIEEGDHRRFCPHQTSHWLGLDVHDVGDYASDGEPRALAPGMVFTVEPGLYIPADETRAPAELRGTGIRIEDDVAVTDLGAEILTAALPTATAELEALLNGTG